MNESWHIFHWASTSPSLLQTLAFQIFTYQPIATMLSPKETKVSMASAGIEKQD